MPPNPSPGSSAPMSHAASATRGRTTLAPGQQESRAIWLRYQDNTARHLIGIARDIQQRALERLEADGGFGGLRPSLGPLIALVTKGPQSQGALARSLSISTQACGQLVDAGEAAHYLERRQSPEDRRTRIVALAPRGQRLVTQGAQILSQIEAEDQRRIGEAALQALGEAIAALHLAWTEEGPLQPTFPASSHPSLGALPLISVHIQQRLMAATSARGHAGLKLSHAQVLPLIGASGARISLLARVQGLSRQAVSATARDLERLGYVARHGLEGDRRAVLLRLTAAGEALIRDSVDALDMLSKEVRDAIGPRNARSLSESAKALYEALGLEREIFDVGEAALAAGIDQAESVEALAEQLHRRLDRSDRKRLATLLTASAAP